MNWKFYSPKFEFKETIDDNLSAWVGHEYFMYDLITNIKPSVFVELGTHWGFSFFSAAQAIKDNNINTKMYAIDTWEGDPQAGLYEGEVYNKFKKALSVYFKGLEVKTLRKKFNDAVKDFDNNAIDVLHIDGLHTYEAVSEDFHNWLPKMKKDGIILFHDISVKDGDFGVYRLWEELRNTYGFFEFYYSNGLGVLFLDKNQFIKEKEKIQMYYSVLREKFFLKLIFEQSDKIGILLGDVKYYQDLLKDKE